MPALMKPTESTETKTQPWKAVWPAPDSAENAQEERKATMSQAHYGLFGFDDKGEGIAPKKE